MAKPSVWYAILRIKSGRCDSLVFGRRGSAHMICRSMNAKWKTPRYRVARVTIEEVKP